MHNISRMALMLALGSVVLAMAPARTQAADEPHGEFETVIKRIEGHDWTDEEAMRFIQIAERIKDEAKRDLSLVQRFERALLDPWVVFGFLAQGAFMMRFVLQIIASERKKRSYVPVAFWYLSIVGGIMLFAYAVERRDPVFMCGQGLGVVIYVRNLILIYRRRDDLDGRLEERRQRHLETEPGDDPDRAT